LKGAFAKNTNLKVTLAYAEIANKVKEKTFLAFTERNDFLKAFSSQVYIGTYVYVYICICKFTLVHIGARNCCGRALGRTICM
jgi:hypothetical protein